MQKGLGFPRSLQEAGAAVAAPGAHSMSVRRTLF